MEDLWVQLASTAFGESFHCPELFGMSEYLVSFGFFELPTRLLNLGTARKPATVSRRNLDRFLEIGTRIILIRRQEKSGS